MMMPDDILDKIGHELTISDLCTILATSKTTAKLVSAYLDRRYGSLYDEYCRSSKFIVQKSPKALLRFASPCTLKEFMYRCASCGRVMSTVGTCSSCSFRLMTRERRETELILAILYRITLTAALVFLLYWLLRQVTISVLTAIFVSLFISSSINFIG